jgi:glycosyltransferase involved in cell wall biosynthesis
MEIKVDKIRVMHTQARLSGGATEYALNIIRNLDRKKYEVFLASGPGRLEHEALAAADRFILIPELRRVINPIYDLVSLIRLYNILKEYKIDIVHTHKTKDGILARIAAWLAGTPVVFKTYHTYFPSMPFYERWLHVIIERLLSRITDHFFTVTETDKENIKKYIGISEDKIDAIYNGFNEEKFKSIAIDRGQKMQELRLNPRSRVVGWVGRFDPPKACHIFLHACRQVLNEVKDVEFILVGDGPLRKRMEDLAQELGIQTNTHFLGYRDDVHELLHTFDVFALSSNFESFGRVIIEAMLARVPVVITDSGVQKEFIEDGISGFLVKKGNYFSLANRITELINDSAKRKIMGERGFQGVAGKFDSSKITRGLESVYGKLYHNAKKELVLYIPDLSNEKT